MSIENSLWKREMREVLAELEDGFSSRQTADALRFLISTSMLSPDDIYKDPRKFFEAHRLLATQVPRKKSGLWIRYMLHYNIFAGTIMALGSSQQVERLVQIKQCRPTIGCFAMTEQNATDCNGMSIETTAELSPDETYFVIHTPTSSAAKNWVSQGLVADECIVIANLIVHGHSYGPQAFWIKLRDEHGNLLEGIDLIDLGPKAAGSDLDNARITFNSLKVPISTHLCKYLQVQNGTVRHHHALGVKVRTVEVLGNHLHTGRIIVAQAALSYTRTIMEQLHDAKAANRSCLTPPRKNRSRRVGIMADGDTNDQPAHVSKGFLSHAYMTLDNLDRFLSKVEKELCHCLVRRLTPPDRLQQAITVAKVEAVETCIDLCSALQDHQDGVTSGNILGSDFLLCCKHAEGESHVLMQKMTRDLLSKLGGEEFDAKEKGPIDAALHDLQRGIMHAQIQTGCHLLQAWEQCSDLVYNVADVHMDSVLQSYGCLMEANRGASNKA